jgi:hypothetical protein
MDVPMQPTVRPAVPYVGPEHDVKRSSERQERVKEEELIQAGEPNTGLFVLAEAKLQTVLPCEPSPINGNRVAVNVVGSFRSKKNGNAFQIIRCTPSSRRDPFCDLLGS